MIAFPRRRGVNILAAPALGIPGGLSLFDHVFPFLIFNVVAVAPPAVVTVCSNGVWSSPISFVPCDDFRVTVDGPAANNLKISATLEFEEP